METSPFKEKILNILHSIQLTNDEKKMLDARYPNRNHEAVAILLYGKNKYK